MMTNTIRAAAALLVLLTGLVNADEMPAGVVFSGTWKSVDTSAERSLLLQFTQGECAIRLKADREELNASGVYQQEETKIYLILRTGGNAETQLEIPYEVIDPDTIEVMVNKKRFTLERQR